MATDIPFYISGDLPQEVAQFRVTQVPAGTITLSDLTATSAPPSTVLDILVETHGPAQPIDLPSPGVEGRIPHLLEWVQISVEIFLQAGPKRPLGRVDIETPRDVSFVSGTRNHARWKWELARDDIERVEAVRLAADRLSPITFEVAARGIAKLRPVDVSLSLGELGYIVAARCGNANYWQIETSHWERLLKQMQYDLPPSQAALASVAITEHPSWEQARKKLEPARKHLRDGEEDDALRECLGALEAVVSGPYKVDSWKPKLANLPGQKSVAIAELMSGLATYCNKTGHHLSQDQQDQTGDYERMPLDRWEAELIVASTQFLLAYAYRLRSRGDLTP